MINARKIVSVFKWILPSPLTIAILLTLITFTLALIFTKPSTVSFSNYSWDLVTGWKDGLWDKSSGGIYFAFQMMLMLVLGHTLALTPIVNRFIQSLIKHCDSTVKSAVIVSFFSILMGLINWGLGLVFGAILARKIGQNFSANKKALNYGLIGACAYLSMLAWHGGLSGSAPIKIMESGYLQEMFLSHDKSLQEKIPDVIPFEATLGSNMNITLTILILIILPFTAYIIAKLKGLEVVPKIKPYKSENVNLKKESSKGADRIDRSNYFGIIIGLLFITIVVVEVINFSGSSRLGFINPNFINFTLLALCLFFHKNIINFLRAIQESIGDVSGILIQFPLYFGILGILKTSGLISLFSVFLIENSNSFSLPIFTYISAGVVNFFVPSGGGQWAIQGPLLIEAAISTKTEMSKIVMAFAYGDQLTNMLQPFWALPLLGITKLKAYQILPYTLIFFIVGAIIFGVGLIIF